MADKNITPKAPVSEKPAEETSEDVKLQRKMKKARK